MTIYPQTPSHPTSVTIRGAPLSVRLAALYLLRRRPELTVHLGTDPGATWLAEGEVVMLSEGTPGWRTTVAPLVTREWQGFLTLAADGRREYPVAIGLIDPVQIDAELSDFASWLLPAPARDAVILQVPPLGEPLRPSKVLEAEFETLASPVLYEAGMSQGEFAQYLPLGQGSTMVRSFAWDGACDPIEAIFGAQYALMALLAEFDR